jgi:hypothetical protein
VGFDHALDIAARGELDSVAAAFLGPVERGVGDID